MAEWKEPVFDRTQADVEYARQMLASNVNDTYYKGCFNVTDISRIENNTAYLAEALISLYYITHIAAGRVWYNSSLPYRSHIDRIINNVSVLWGEYYKPAGSVDLPTTLIAYEQVNALEKNIYLLKEMLDDMISSFRECGTFACGEE